MLDLVIPVFNEEHVLETSIGKLQEFMADVPTNWRIVVVNNGSTDNTADVARRLSDDRDYVELLDLTEKGPRPGTSISVDVDRG